MTYNFKSWKLKQRRILNRSRSYCKFWQKNSRNTEKIIYHEHEMVALDEYLFKKTILAVKILQAPLGKALQVSSKIIQYVGAYRICSNSSRGYY